MVFVKVLFLSFPGGTEKDDDEPQRG